MGNIWEITLDLLNGFKSSFALFTLTLVISLPLGLVIAKASMSRFVLLKYLSKGFVWIIRGTPLMLQIFVIFYVPGLLISGFRWPDLNISFLGIGEILSTRFIAALVAFGINYAAYFSEIYRGGIQSIPESQYEACKMLGMSKSVTFRRVILLQVIKRIIPSMSNEIITLIKDTALANVIAVQELMFEASQKLLEGLIWPIFYAGLFYLIFNGVVTFILGRIEKKLEYFKV